MCFEGCGCGVFEEDIVEESGVLDRVEHGEGGGGHCVGAKVEGGGAGIRAWRSPVGDRGGTAIGIARRLRRDAVAVGGSHGEVPEVSARVRDGGKRQAQQRDVKNWTIGIVG